MRVFRIFVYALSALITWHCSTAKEIEGPQPVSSTETLAWKELNIIPMPKQIKLSGKDRQLEEKWIIIIGKEASKQAIIGADWIKKKIGYPLKVSRDISENSPRIIIGTPADNELIKSAVEKGIVNVGKDNPGERGYEIQTSDAGKTIYLAGADDIGVLYACVTFSELVEKKDGMTFWREAEVRDWPDSIKVCLGPQFVGTTATPEICKKIQAIKTNKNPTEKQKKAYLDAVKEYYDWLLKRKVTLLNYHGFFLRGGAFVHTKGMDIIKQGIQYGKDRGIGAIAYAEKPFAGVVSRFPDIAKKNKCLISAGSHSRYERWIRCWSQDEIRRKTAEDLAKFIHALGLTDIGFHDTDTGYYDNPADWNYRCEECKKRWGDDYAAAVINKHKIYYEEVKKLNPEICFHFTFYPYSVQILDPESGYTALKKRYGNSPTLKQLGKKYREKYTEFWRRINAAFPIDDVTFCIREADSGAIEAYRKLTPKRGACIWFGLMIHPWRPLFSQASSWTYTFCGNKRDLFFVCYTDIFMPLEPLAVRQYSWNKNSPGAKHFERDSLQDSEHWKFAEPEGEIYSVVLPLLTRNVFGDKAAPYITEAVSQNIDLRQIFNESKLQYRWLKSYNKMKWQADNVEKAKKALDALWDECEKTKSKMGMDDYAFRRFVYLRESIHMSFWMANARAQNLLAHELAIKQKANEAEKAIEKGLRYLDEAEEDRKKLLNEKPDDEVIKEKPHNKALGAWRMFMSERADFSFAKKALLQTRSEIKELGSMGMTPEYIVKSICSERTVRALRTNSKINLDGVIDEDEWKNSYPIETFLVFKKGRETASAHTRARLLYDKENIFLSLNCHVPGDKNASPEDTVELFLTNPEMKGDYVHFFIKADSSVKQQYNKVQNVGVGVRKWLPDNSWKCAGLKKIISRKEKEWTAEISIPIKSLSGKPESPGWKINIARSCPMESGCEYSSILPSQADGFHDMEHFPPLIWTKEKAPSPVIEINTPEFGIRTETLPDCIATVAELKLEIESDIVLHDVKITVEAFGADGKKYSTKTLSLDRVFYKWISLTPVVLEYQQVWNKGGILVELNSEEGGSERWFRFGGWQGTDKIGSIYSEGLNGGQGLFGSCYFPSGISVDDVNAEIFNSASGTIEFWIKPSWQAYWSPPRANGEIHIGRNVFVHYGPYRKQHPLHTNNSPFALWHSGAKGSIICGMKNVAYKGCAASAPVKADKSWTAGSWHHIACVWDGKAPEDSQLVIYLDGKNISKFHPSKNVSVVDKNSLKNTFPFPIQISSMNSGWNAANAIIDELRISRTARYKNNFVPSKRKFDLDDATTALFHFDGDLSGKGFTRNGKEYTIQAKAGSADI